MAQKTPLPALTVNYADRWNLTWFSDLADFKRKLVADYYLRFLLMSYLRFKRYWLHLFSINQSGGYYYIQLSFLLERPQINFKAFVFPTPEKKELLKKTAKTLQEANHTQLLFKNLNSQVFRQTLPFKKQQLWAKFRKLVQFRSFQKFNDIFTNVNQTKLLKIKGIKKLYKPSQIQSIDFVLNKNVSQQLLATLNANLYFIYQDQFLTLFTWLSLLNVQEKNTLLLPQLKLEAKLKLPLFLSSFFNKTAFNLNNAKFKPLASHKTSESQKVYQKSYGVQRRLFSTAFENKAKVFNLPGKKLAIWSKPSLNAQARNELFFCSALKLNFNKRKGLYQLLYLYKSYLFKRIFAFKRFRSVKEGFNIFFKRFGDQWNLVKTLRRLKLSPIFLQTALRRVTKSRVFFSYLPIKWNFRTYQTTKKMVVFDKFGYKRYFVPTFVALHLAMSKGSAALVVDLLVRKLRILHQHTQFLACVEKICRYFLAYPDSNVAYSHSLCKGMEILFIGKVNGSDRSKVWRFKFGPMHTSTFYTNTREEHAKCYTKYGMFHIRVRMKLGSFTPYLDSAYFF